MSTAASHSQCLAKLNPLGQPSPNSAQRKLTFGKKRIPLRRRVALHHVLQVQSKAGFGRGTVKIKEEEEIDAEPESEPSTGTKKFPKLPGTIKLPGPAKSQAKGQSQAKSNKVVFVAGATGKVGSRTVRELLKLGFRVRAGTRNTEKAQGLFEDVLQNGPSATGSNDGAPFGFFSPAKLFGFLKPKASKALEFVECDLEDVESIESALGNAGAVVCCIGASEKEVLDVSGPYRIDFKATENLIKAASSAQVDHFVLVTSLGTQKFGFPAAVLNLFWGVLVWKAKAEKALLQSGLPYTIVRPGGMERPTDDYKETHNLILSEADKLFGGQVSRLQVAELLASIIENPEVSVNKVIEAIAETTAPLRPIREMLEEIPSKDDPVSSVKSQSPRKSRPVKDDVAAPEKVSKKQEEEKFAEEKRALASREKEEKQFQAKKLAEEKLARAEKEKEEKRIRAENDEKERLRLQALRKKYEQEIEAAREKEEAANSAAAAALAEKTELEKRAAEVRAKAEAAALAASQAKAVEAAVLAAAQQGNVLSDAEKEKIKESVRLARLPTKEDSPKEAKKPSPKKKPAFSFFGKVAPSTEPDTGVESESKEDQAKVDAEPTAKAKAGKEADAKLAGQKKQEEKVGREEEAKKLTALEAKKKAEQGTAEKEAKEKAEKEAAEAKKKQEAEAKRKEEEAEAERLKVEAEEKAKAEAKIKEEAEAKRKEEKAAETERLKVEAEEKAKAEREAEDKRKEEELAEAKKKEEQEKAEKESERLRVEAKEKAKALAEQAATAAAAAAAEVEKKGEELKKTVEAPAAPRGKGFRWFWQPGKPDAVEDEQTTSEGETAEEKLTTSAGITAQAKATEQLPPSPTPLSPYTRYPGLKPPCPPLGSTSTGKVDPPKVDKVDISKVDLVTPTINKVEQIKEEVEILAEKGKEVVTEVAPDSQEDIKARSKLAPEPQEDIEARSKLTAEPQEDIEARAKLAQETAAREKEALEKAEAAVSLKWLWEKTDPAKETITSTAPKKEDSVSSSKKEDSVSSSKKEDSVPLSNDKEPVPFATSKSDDLPRSSRPLSPYAQFPDLKPPAPPLPSPPAISNLVEEVKESDPLPASPTPLSPYPGFSDLKPPPSPTPLYNQAGNGAVPENAEENQEIKVESTPSSSFKWPWQG